MEEEEGREGQREGGNRKADETETEADKAKWENLGRIIQKAMLGKQHSHFMKKICERFESKDKQIILKTAKN